MENDSHAKIWNRVFPAEKQQVRRPWGMKELGFGPMERLHLQLTADSLWRGPLLVSDLGPNYLHGSVTAAKVGVSWVGMRGEGLCYLRRLPSPSCLPLTPIKEERVGLLRPLPVLPYRIICSVCRMFKIIQVVHLEGS